MSKILEVEDLVLRFYTYEGVVKALEGVSFYIKDGNTLGLVGETGCGKTMTSLSVLDLIPSPGRIEGGKVLFRSQSKPMDILKEKETVKMKIRGKDISMVFQEPASALNPVFNAGEQISEVILKHRRKELTESVLEKLEKDIETKGQGSLKGRIYRLERKIYKKTLKNPNSISLKLLSRIPLINRYKGRINTEAKKSAISTLHELEIPDPERVVDMYPHELSGGMQQRVVIAMALACNPFLLIADEPTTSLDVTIQAGVLELIKTLKSKFHSSVLFVTHDMGIIAEMCDRVAVMYAGTVCEVADVFEIFKNPLHPYAKGLLESIPRPGKEFKSIPGTVPSLIEPPPGCRFHPRCSYAMEVCTRISPQIAEVKKEHFVACHLFTGSPK